MWNLSNNRKFQMIFYLSGIFIGFCLAVIKCDQFQQEITTENLLLDDEIIKPNFTIYPTKIAVKPSKIPNYTIVNIDCKEYKKDFQKILVDEEYKLSCDNLQPCKDYLVKVEIFNNSSNKNTSYTDLLTTEYDKPIISNQSLITFTESIHLYWNSTNQECIAKYEITGRTNETSHHFEPHKYKNNVEFKELLPCQNYTIYFQCIDIKNETIANNTIPSRTNYTDPGPVKSVQFDYIENNSSVKVTWTPPNHKFCVQYYILKWAPLNVAEYDNSKNLEWSEHNHTDTTNTNFVIKNLIGCQMYIFKIFNNNDENNNLNKTFVSPEQVPGPVRELKIQIKFSTTARITWKKPGNNSCIKIYEIDLNGPNGSHQSFTSKQEFYTLDDLKPCGSYKVAVTPVTQSDLRGPKAIVPFTTLTDKPSKVQNITVTSYPKRVHVTWQKPNFSELCVDIYHVVASYQKDDNSIINSFDNTTKKNDIIIDKLKSCTLYTIKIIAIAGNLVGEEAQIQTESIATPPSPPDNLELKQVTHESLELRAGFQDVDNNCDILFVRFRCSTEDDVKIKYGETTIDVKASPTIYVGAIKPLSPNTQYSCRCAIFNVAGWSNNSQSLCKTSKYYPDTPESIQINHTTTNSIHILWKSPKYSNGEISMYKLHIQTLRPLYRIPQKCSNIEWYKKTIEVSKTEYLFQDALSYVEYGIQVAVMNDFGVSEFSTIIRASTQQSVPEPIRFFATTNILGPSLSENEYEASVTISWELPCRSNGLIKYFHLNFNGSNYETNEISFNRTIHIMEDPLKTGQEIFIFNETDLEPECQYLVTIHVHLDNDFISAPTKLKFTSPSGIPRKFNVTGLGIIDAFVANNPTISAVARFDKGIFLPNMGYIQYAAILISEKYCQEEPVPKFGVIKSNYDWPNISNWYEAQSNPECIILYQTTPLRWIPSLGNHLILKSSTIHITFQIGTDIGCADKPKEFCNGPLKPGTEYHVILRLFTSSGFNDVGSFSFYTDSKVNIIFIMLLAVICLLLAFFVGITYIYVTKRILWHRESIIGMENVNGDVTAKNFLLNYSDLSKRDKIQREFKELTTITSDLDLSNNASKLNSQKNRYSNIYPYDKNRVILDCDSDGSDYINASFINGYKKKKEYIATQGPKPDSFIDFWRMILQYNVRVIAMVTEMREGDTIKCHQYFPLTQSESLRFGHNIIVICKKEDVQQSAYERRELIVKHLGYGVHRNVIHYAFKKWPDHDCPTDPTDLINFIRKIKSEKNSSHSPIVVHCSAGVGRTGTFIGLDIIMQRLKSENKINIFETVKELRFQRMRMVQTIQQYQFLYKCAFQLVKKNFSPINKQISNNNNGSSSNGSLLMNNNSTSSMGCVIGNSVNPTLTEEVRLNHSCSAASLPNNCGNDRIRQSRLISMQRQRSFTPSEMEAEF